MADELARRVGIIGIGGPNSVGYELGIKLYNECSRAGIPEGLLMYNRPPKIKGELLKEHPELKEELHKGHVFLEKMLEDLSFGSLCEVYRIPKSGYIINKADSWELRYESKQAEKKIFAEAYKDESGLDALLRETDSPNSVVVVSFEAAKGWYEWMNNVSPEKAMQIRRYLYYHNITGAIEFADALKKYYKNNNRKPHQAHKIIVTNPPCRIMETIRMAAGKAAGPASRFSAYAAIDERRISKELKSVLKQRPEFTQIEREHEGEIAFPIKNIFQVGRHAGNIFIRGQEKMFNSTTLWSIITIGGMRFYNTPLGNYEHLDKVQEDIEKSAHRAFMKDLKKYSGRTTQMIIPTLSEIILDIISNKDFSAFNKKAYTMGHEFKMTGTKQPTFVWPVVYKDGHAWPYTDFDPLDIKQNIEYEPGKTPKVRPFSFIEDKLRKDEVSNCYEIYDDTIKPELEETSEFLENPKKLKRVVSRHKNIFIIKGKFRPIISLDDLLGNRYKSFLGKNFSDYNDAYENAMKMINSGCYDPEEITNFLNELSEFKDKPNFHYRTGPFISAMIDNIFEPGLQLTLDLSRYKRLHAVGMHNRADLIITGDLGNAAGMYMRDGSIIGENALNRVCQYQSGGEATFKQIGSFGGQGKKGGVLKIRQAQNRLGEGMENGVIILNGNCADDLAYAMKSGKIIVEGNAKDNACDKIEGGTVIINGACKSFGKIMGGEVIWQGKMIK